ncbi:MAG: hypothetical protein LBR80_16380 [Deltaproteobacteria bacterium]|jgi:hypothetical protein|nr:hypothetical protein [Deltaproteobacteria bacterium]
MTIAAMTIAAMTIAAMTIAAMTMAMRTMAMRTMAMRTMAMRTMAMAAMSKVTMGDLGKDCHRGDRSARRRDPLPSVCAGGSAVPERRERPVRSIRERPVRSIRERPVRSIREIGPLKRRLPGGLSGLGGRRGAMWGSL